MCDSDQSSRFTQDKISIVDSENALMINRSAARAIFAAPVLVLLSFLVACCNLESLFFGGLGGELFLGHSWMRELINHQVLLLTLKGIQPSLLYLLSACEMCLSAGSCTHISYSQGEMSDPKCNSHFYLEENFARCSTNTVFVFSLLAQQAACFQFGNGK